VIAVEYTTIARLRAHLEYHQAKRQILAEQLSDLDAAYDAETDCAESYHAGCLETLTAVLGILQGREVILDSEDEGAFL